MCYKKIMFSTVVVCVVSGLVFAKQGCMRKFDDPLYPLGQNYVSMDINIKVHKYHIKRCARRIRENMMMSESVKSVYQKAVGEHRTDPYFYNNKVR